jgi:putative phage-type endonuclease
MDFTDSDYANDPDSDASSDTSFMEALLHMSHPNEPKTPFIDTLTEDEIDEMHVTISEMADEYVTEHVLEMLDPQFHKKMVDDVTAILFDQWSDAGLCSHGEDDDDPEDDFDDVREFVGGAIDEYWDMSVNFDDWAPIRSRSMYSDTRLRPSSDPDIARKVSRIRSIPQPEQRTAEWYEFRHDLITASNLYKVFGTEAVRNSLIYEKCLPLKDDADCTGGYVNTASPMHWGQKYEPVSVALYEYLYKAKVEDFGCIRHPEVPCIGASPDGIVTDPGSHLYGRMLEIKNIVNREMDGIPSKAYWVQMQMQMETCDLDTCDFLETRFKEYEGEDAFYADSEREYRGVILYFVERVSIGGSLQSNENGYPLAQQYSGVPKYVYMPFSVGLNKECVDAWIEETRTKMRRSWSMYSTLYWYLDEYSCVLVERNMQWFAAARGLIEETWATVLNERVSGYEHRAAKKKVVKLPGLEIVHGEGVDESRVIKNLPVLGGVCLVKLV